MPNQSSVPLPPGRKKNQRVTRKNAPPFAVAQCSLCDQFKLTFGQQFHGGVRYCQECLKSTLGWFQMSDSEKERVTELYERLGRNSEVQQQLADAAKVNEDPELLKSHGIGESYRRLREAGDY
jgi:hypothetical protein